MKRPFSPLVWLCAVGAIALGALALYDPTGVYADYIAALDSDKPVIAAVFTAAQDGVYPWSGAVTSENARHAPAYRPLTETVTDEEMRSSVGNNAPFGEPVPETQPADGNVSGITPSVEVIPYNQAPESAESGEDKEESGNGFITVDETWFDDALFIGDSHTEGFCDYAGLHNATYYYKRGLDVWSVMKKAFVGGKMTIPQALSQRRFGKIYIMLGINEIGNGTTESFAAQYADVIAQLRELQPDALIYIQSIFHTSQKKSDSSIYNNDTINARNEAISHIADDEHVFFLDCNQVFDDESGVLTSSYTGDGVHVMAPYYTLWRDYLFLFGRANVTPAEAPATGKPSSGAAPAAPAAPADLPQPVFSPPGASFIASEASSGLPDEAIPPAPVPEPSSPLPISESVSQADEPEPAAPPDQLAPSPVAEPEIELSAVPTAESAPESAFESAVDSVEDASVSPEQIPEH